MKKCRWFSVSELVSPDILKVVSEQACWNMLAPWIDQLDMLRDLVGIPLWINGRGKVDSGVRTLTCKIGAKKSRHKMIQKNVIAMDIKCRDMARLENVVRNNWAKLGIVRIENPKITVSWLHVEFCSMGSPRLVVFDP